MRCTKCGQELPEGTKVCQYCGIDPETSVAEALQAPVAEDVWESQPFELNLEGEVKDPPKKTPEKKKKKTVLIVSAIAAALLLVVGLIGFLVLDWGLFIRDFFQRMKDPEEYKNIVEERAITDSGMSELGILKKVMLSTYGNNREFAEKGGREISVQLQMDGQLRSMLKLALTGNEEALALLDSLGNVELTLSTANVTDRMQGTLELGLDGQHLASVDVVLDMAEDTLYLTVPEVNETAYIIQLEAAPPALQAFAYSQKTNQAWNNFVLRCPDEETLSETIDSFLIPAIHALDDVQMDTDGQMEAGGVSQNATVLTYDITDKTLQNMAVAMLETARNDDRMMDLLDNYSQLASEINAINRERVDKGLLDADALQLLPTLDGKSVDDAIAEVKSWETTGETVLTVQTYVNRKGQITGRTYRLASGMDISYRLVIKGRNVGLKLQVENGSNELTLEGSAKYKGGLTGSATLKGGSDELLTIEIEDIPLKGKGGTILVQPGRFVSDLLATETGIPAGLVDFSKLGVKISLSEESTEIALQMSDNNLLHATVKTEIVEVSQVELPKKSTDKPLMWALGIDTQNAIDILERLGLKDQLIDMLLEKILGGIVGGGTEAA